MATKTTKKDMAKVSTKKKISIKSEITLFLFNQTFKLFLVVWLVPSKKPASVAETT